MISLLTSPWLLNFALFALTACAALFFTPVWARAARRLGIVAAPVGGRHIHTRATPQGGGVAVFLAFHIGLALFVAARQIPPRELLLSGFPGFFLASLLLLAVGLVDDARNIRPLTKLLGQAAAATCVFLMAGVRLSRLGPLAGMPLWLDYAATVLWVTLVINAFNLIDGMDGVASGLAVIISFGTAGAQLFLGNPLDALPYLLLAGACLGFLRHNFHPASVFLGDTGSMFIGLSLASFPLMTGTHKEFLPAATIPLLMMGIPFYDTMAAVWRRTVRAILARFFGVSGGGGIMSGDKDHVHHRALAHFASQRKAVFFLYGVNVLLAVGALSLLMWKARGTGLFIVVFMLITALVVRHLNAVELWDTGRLVLNQTSGRLWHRLRVPVYIAADFAAMSLSWLATRALLSLPVTGESFRSGFLLLALPVFMALLVSRVYNRIWTRARPHEFATIPCAVALAGCVALALLHLLDICCEHSLPETVLFCVAAAWPLLGMRMFSFFLRDYMGLLDERRLGAGGARSIIFGCGGRFALYLHERNRQPAASRRAIAGLLDDDPLLKGRIISGFKVFGPLEALPLLVGKTGAGELVVTPKLAPGRRAEILRVASRANCHVVFFEVGEQAV